MIIDCHAHPDWIGYNLKKTLQNMHRFNIDKAWLLTLETPKSEYDPGFYNCNAFGDYIYPMPFITNLSYAQRAPGKFILGYAPDPRLPDSIDKLKAAIDIYEVRVYGELMLRMMYDNPDAIRMFRFCGDKGLPVISKLAYGIDTGYEYPRRSWWYGGGIEAYERALQACPETIFLGHGPGFWAHISSDFEYDKASYPKTNVEPGGKLIDMMQKYSNLYCDLSAYSGLNALKRDKNFTKQFILEFQDRILYGRDFFDNALQEFLISLGLPDAVLDKVYYLNALKLVP